VGFTQQTLIPVHRQVPLTIRSLQLHFNQTRRVTLYCRRGWEIISTWLRLRVLFPAAYASNFSTPDCKENQQGTPGQGNSNLQWPWWDSYKGVDHASTIYAAQDYYYYIGLLYFLDICFIKKLYSIWDYSMQ